MATGRGNCGRGALWYGGRDAEESVLAGLTGDTSDAVQPMDFPSEHDTAEIDYLAERDDTEAEAEA